MSPPRQLALANLLYYVSFGTIFSWQVAQEALEFDDDDLPPGFH